MKRNRITRPAAAFFAGCLALAAFLLPARSEPLTDDQIAALEEKLATLRIAIKNRHSQLNDNAGDVFLSASQDPSEAIALYLKCHWIVNFEREGREEREFDDWKDNQRDQLKDPRFLEGLQAQLRWLALSCKAAEAETLEAVFPSLLSYADGLTRLTEMPSQALLSSVSSSVFAQAYGLQNLLSRNQNWEQVPFNVGGIYEKTVLPYLRENDADKLMGAWDRRIAQQTQLVEFLESLEDRGNRREERRKAETQVRQMQGQRNGGSLIKAHDKDDFLRETLPELKLGKLADMYRYIDQSQGATALIGYIEANIEHEKAADWLERVSGVLASGAAKKSSDSTVTTTPPPAPPATTTPPLKENDGKTSSGKVPPGLVPAN